MATVASSLALVAATMFGLRGKLAAGAPLKLEPGEYAVTITYEVQDQRQNESRLATRCITVRDLDDPEAIFSDRIGAPRNEEAACSVREWKDAGGKVSYDADCSNRTVHVEGSFSETEFMVVRKVTPKASPRVLLTFVVAGKRSGECKDNARARAGQQG